MPTRFSIRKPNDKGVAAVEFGLLLPVLLIILLGIMEYGYLYFVHLNMTNAAREGARAGVVRDDATQATQTAHDVAVQYLQNAGITASVPQPTLNTTTGELVVQINKNYAPGLIGFVPVPNTIGARATMRWELTPAP